VDVSTSAIRKRSAALALAVTVLSLVLTACGSASTNSSRAARGASIYQRLVAGYISYAHCARTHGMPNLPDPQVDDQGNDHYPSLDRQGSWRWPEGVLAGCAKVWDRVHAIRDQYDSAHPQGRLLSAATYSQQLALARCIRAHGFPTFPDPNADGSNTVSAMPAGFAKPNLSPEARAAIAACGKESSP
jgi:hypothetical protein